MEIITKLGTQLGKTGKREGKCEGKLNRQQPQCLGDSQQSKKQSIRAPKSHGFSRKNGGLTVNNCGI